MGETREDVAEYFRKGKGGRESMKLEKEKEMVLSKVLQEKRPLEMAEESSGVLDRKKEMKILRERI